MLVAPQCDYYFNKMSHFVFYDSNLMWKRNLILHVLMCPNFFKKNLGHVTCDIYNK